MNELFLKVALLLAKINKGEIKEIDTSYKNNVVDNYLSTIIRLLKEEVNDDYFNFKVDYEFGRINMLKVSKEEMDSIYVLKHLTKFIKDKDNKGFLEFSKYFIDEDYYYKIKTLSNKKDQFN